MNERIQKLAEQAGLRVESWMTNPPKPFQILGSVEDFEKFAKLIIHECATLKLDPIQIDEAQYYHGWLDYRDEIFEHFKDEA